jgi:DHA3 family tetracycline resistance protein-like MFS transporter
MRGAQAEQAGSVLGIILSTILGNLSLSLPIICSGVFFIVLGMFLALRMPEYNFKTSAPEDLNTFGKMGHTLKASLGFIKRSRIIMMLLSVTLFYGLSSEGYDRLSAAHFLKDTTLPKLGDLQPVTWFGIFGIAGMVLSAAVMQLIIKRLKKNNRLQSAGILLNVNIFYILSMLLFALTGNFGVMLAAYLSTNMFRIINAPVFSAWLNSHINDSARATILSTNGQIDALGQIIGGPIIGIIASRFSISTGIACTALLTAPVIVLYIMSIISDRKGSKIIEVGYE